MKDRRVGTTPSEPVARARTRKRIRLGSLLAGLAMVVAAGGALAPSLVPDSLAAPVTTRMAATPAVGQADPAPHSTPTQQEQSAESARADRPSRGERPPLEPVPGSEQLSPAPSSEPAPEPKPEPRPIAGIPDACPIDMPIDPRESAAQITDRAEQQWGVQLSGPQWRDDEYRSVVQLFAETLDAVDCTDYLNRVKQGNGGELGISSEPTTSWSWGDYGLTRSHTITLDFVKFRQGYADGDRGRLVRLIIHEMAHSLNADRHAEPAYWRSFNTVWNASGPVSAYGSTPTESFADAVGYYVARCAADNPYATGDHADYYDYVRTSIFDGREFGGSVGTAQHCVIEGR